MKQDVQEHLNLTSDQESIILDSYRSMHGMLVRCAEERNTIIFPDIQEALNLFPKVGHPFIGGAFVLTEIFAELK